MRLAGEQAKANIYVVGKCKGKGDGGCRQVGEKAALAAKANLEKSVSSATASGGYSGGLPHMTREVEQYHGVVSANGVYHKSINGTRHEQANAHRRAILDDRIECCV